MSFVQFLANCFRPHHCCDSATSEASQHTSFKPVDSKWFQKIPATPLDFPDFPYVTDCFLWHAQQHPDRAIMADQNLGVLSFRTSILCIMIMVKRLRTLPGKYIGILMPATAASNLAFLSALFAGKTPVMLNWTVGARNMRYAIESMSLSTIITSRRVIQKLSNQGTDISAAVEHFLYLEDMLLKAPFTTKLACKLASYLSWNSLRKAEIPETAIILFTSGSENFPKTVPLTHENLISDIVSALRSIGVKQDTRVLGMLPPFHSFGVWLDFMIPDVAGLQTVYHPNPMAGSLLARTIEAYKATLIVGTPTFVTTIYRKGTPDQLASIKIAIVGAESCPLALSEQVSQKTPNAILLEGYGITECSPVLTVNLPSNHKIGTLGFALDCIEWTVRDKELKITPQGETGMLYVRGPNVFSGYLNYEGLSPFVEIDGKSWFRSGDLVCVDSEGFLVYRGRLSRFVKIGGEMISLPAIESILTEKLMDDSKEKNLAVENIGEVTKPLITLFTTVPRTREDVNKILADAGLSPISFIRNIIELPEIPHLGSGKTDYRRLAALGKEHEAVQEQTAE